MKLKKILTIALTVIMLLSAFSVPTFAAGLEELPDYYEFGVGPETQGFSIDYRYFSPVKENDSKKYPLVIWLHGMGDGAYDGKQIIASDINNWTTDDFQSRFKDSGGAFIFAPRSVEEQELYWTDELVYPLRAAIDDFIEKNKEHIDTTRIYAGGYSMGGKMTLKMAAAYPDMFAAIFPICPAWIPGEEAIAYLADTPVWMVSGARDILVNYYSYVLPTWDRIVNVSSDPESCRLSTLVMTLYPNGVPCSSSHFSWFSVNNDMFSARNGKYPLLKTQNGLGEKVELTYPDGMISWLSGFESDFSGKKATDSGNSHVLKTDGRTKGIKAVGEYFRNLFRHWRYILNII